MILGALGLGLLVLWPVPTRAQDGRRRDGEARPPAPGAPFVDRDGDGIHDEMEHRFHKRKRHHGKHGAGKGEKARQRQQGRPSR